MTRRPDPHSQATDALQQKCKNLGLLYAFLPFSLIGRVLLRVKKKALTMILVTPNWHAQPWYSQILDLCITEPLLLPQSGTFGRSQGTSTCSSVEQDFKTNALENFRKNLVEKGI